MAFLSMNGSTLTMRAVGLLSMGYAVPNLFTVPALACTLVVAWPLMTSHNVRLAQDQSTNRPLIVAHVLTPLPLLRRATQNWPLVYPNHTASVQGSLMWRTISSDVLGSVSAERLLHASITAPQYLY